LANAIKNGGFIGRGVVFCGWRRGRGIVIMENGMSL